MSSHKLRMVIILSRELSFWLIVLYTEKWEDPKGSAPTPTTDVIILSEAVSPCPVSLEEPFRQAVRLRSLFDT